MRALDPPMALLAEVTHRCPLQCPYCSNPVELDRVAGELDTDSWCRVLDEAAALGVLQVHFSGGEPLVRRDLETLVGHAARAGLYTNLITSAVLLDQRRLDALATAGIEHVQISFHLPLTVNAVVHRQNLSRLGAMIDTAIELGARRLEVAHVQYYGWALANRAALLPTRAQLDAATATVEEARERLRGRLVIDYVVPDYHAALPKACMSGWGRRFMNLTPSGKALPCHAAETLPGIDFPSVRQLSLAEIWRDSDAFNRFRGTDWMEEPCRSCERREIDWGGCRCQAFALTGKATATDPVCFKATERGRLAAAVEATHEAPPPFVYRRMSGLKSPDVGGEDEAVESARRGAAR